MIVNQGFSWILNFIGGTAAPGINYLAIGDSSAPPQMTDTKLGNEIIRIPITGKTQDTQSAIYEVFFDRNDANFEWKEIALFAGGTAAKGSGTMVAKAAANESKDNKRTVTVTWEIRLNNRV